MVLYVLRSIPKEERIIQVSRLRMESVSAAAKLLDLEAGRELKPLSSSPVRPVSPDVAPGKPQISEVSALLNVMIPEKQLKNFEEWHAQARHRPTQSEGEGGPSELPSAQCG